MQTPEPLISLAPRERPAHRPAGIAAWAAPGREHRRALGRARVVPADTLVVALLNGERWLTSTEGNWRILADRAFVLDLNRALAVLNDALAEAAGEG